MNQTKQKPTPGDWCFEIMENDGWDDIAVYSKLDSEPDQIAWVGNDSGTPTNKERNKANARLIVAAPEMLFALILAQAQLGDLVRGEMATDDDREAYEAVKTAIRSAEGGS